MMQISIAQLCHTTLTITQTLQPAVHQTYRTFSWIKQVLMQKEKTHCHQMRKTLKHKCKPPPPPQNDTNTDRQQNRAQNKCINTAQGNKKRQ